MLGSFLHARSSLVAGVIAAAIVGALALGASSGLAAGPNAPCNSPSSKVVSCHFSGSFVDDDFCGTGETVDGSYEGHFALPPAGNRSSDDRNNSESTQVLTNPATGATVLTHSAYQFTGSTISGDPNGLHTVRWMFKGDTETIRDPRGGVIARDAGNFVVDVTFDGDDLLGYEIVVDDGGHSLFMNDCSALVPALGLA